MVIENEKHMLSLGVWLGQRVRGGELFELIGDVGAGKTTLTRGIAQGMGIADSIQSPTFTISREYVAPDGLHLAHYDFYRLAEAGIMASELQESLTESDTVTIIEWSDVAADVLPSERITITISPHPDSEQKRIVTYDAGGDKLEQFMKGFDNVRTT